MNNIYYVYAYLRSKDSATAKAGTPYYIGKGKERRAWEKHDHNVNRPIDDCNIVILEENMDEYDACDKEIRMIRWYGRIDLGTGILHNKTDGGDGLRNLSKDTRKKMSDAKLGILRGPMSQNIKNAIGMANKGHVVTEGTKDKIREKRKLQTILSHTDEAKLKISQKNSGEGNGMFGKKHSPEIREKIREAGRNRIWTENTKKKISQANTGRKGKPWSDERRAKMKLLPRRPWSEEERLKRQSNRKSMSEETKRKIGEANRGRKLPPISEETRDKLRRANLAYRQKLKDEALKE